MPGRSRPLVTSISAVRAMLACGACWLLLGCERETSDEGHLGNVSQSAGTAVDGPGLRLPKQIPTPEAPLGREELLAAARRAADAQARGASTSAEIRDLAGRRFTMKLPVGCFGPTDENIDDGVAWSYDAEEKRLRLVATPEIVKETPLVQAIGGADFEAVEGFWIPRPWLMSGACPRGTSAEPAPLTAPPREVGLAQFFPAAESRAAQRDGRSFESVTRVEQEELPVPGAFTLVLNGRVAALPDGSIIRCHSDSPNTRPTCLISVEFDRVSFENSTTGSTVATWQTG